MRALRHTKTGELYPMHEHLAKHPDVEFVTLDEKMQVIEPEETGPAKRKRTRTKRTEEPTTVDDTSDLDGLFGEE